MENFSKEDFAKFMAFMREQQAKETVKETSMTSVAERPEPKEQATAHQTDSDEEEKNILITDFVIEERARSLASREKFYEAASLCEDFTHVDEMDVGIKLLVAECYVQLGRENRAEKAIKDIEKILRKPPMFNVDDVINLAKDLNNNSNYIRALLLLRIAFDVLMQDSTLSPDEKVDHGFCCLNKMDDVIDGMKPASEDGQKSSQIQKALAMARSDASKFFGTSNKKKISVVSERTRVLSLDYGVEVMEKMHKKIEAINNSDSETKSLKLARLANHVNLHYKAFGQFAKAVKVLQFTIDRLEKQFGKNARHYRIYSVTLYNMGSDCLISENFKESESYVTRALEAAEYALDFESEEVKRLGIKGIEGGLRAIHSNLHKMA